MLQLPIYLEIAMKYQSLRISLKTEEWKDLEKLVRTGKAQAKEIRS